MDIPLDSEVFVINGALAAVNTAGLQFSAKEWGTNETKASKKMIIWYISARLWGLVF